jgi:hypothetical protein
MSSFTAHVVAYLLVVGAIGAIVAFFWGLSVYPGVTLLVILGAAVICFIGVVGHSLAQDLKETPGK